MKFIHTVLLAFCLASGSANAADQIRIVGSSTVYPFSASVAEHFGKAGDFRTPVVEATGTGAGLKLFCNGKGKAFPLITNASRAILPSESAQCTKNGIYTILEAKFGFDGITIANSVKGHHFQLSRRELFLALARFVPKDGEIIPNPYRKWSDINASLPDAAIKLYGTSPVSGTYDTFIELVMKKGCAQVKELELLVKDKDEREKNCKMLREDGLYVEAGENGNLIAQKLMNDTDALGILGFSFLDQNSGRLQGSIIDGSAPAFESIQNGSYPISRPLYFYIKGDGIPNDSGIREYVQEFMSEGAIGDEGYLVIQGLVPLPEAERKSLRAKLLQELQKIY